MPQEARPIERASYHAACRGNYYVWSPHHVLHAMRIICCLMQTMSDGGVGRDMGSQRIVQAQVVTRTQRMVAVGFQGGACSVLLLATTSFYAFSGNMSFSECGGAPNDRSMCHMITCNGASYTYR